MTVHKASRPMLRDIGYDGSSSTVWDDLRISGSSVRIGASAPDLVQFLGAGNLRINAFDGAATLEQVYFAVQLPHGYKIGTDIYPHVHWCPTTGAAGSVVWQLEYSWVDINGTFPASTTITVTDATESTAWKHHIAGFSAISGSGISTVSSMLNCRLFRDPAHASDDYGADAGLLEIDFHYELDTIGSLQSTSKV